MSFLKNTDYSFLFIVLLLLGCNPKEEDKIDIGLPPQNVSFDVVPTAQSNTFSLTNTTEGTFIHQWDLGNGNTADGEQVEAYYPRKGTYEIKLTAFSKGGHSVGVSTIEITEDDPALCSGVVELLTDCDQKTWTLEPAAGALHVGPDLQQTWWNNSEADVAARSCHFNDEYTFYADGRFEYDNKGDFWADTDGNGVITPGDLGLTPGCQPSTAWPDQYKVWDSGVHSFTASDDQLTISGLGAWMGLYKVGTSAEITAPQTSVSYNILEISATRMIIYVDYGGLAWRFTFVAA
ncbi:MAG: PKD domain-containing protein [Bacteroidota bacterium]